MGLNNARKSISGVQRPLGPRSFLNDADMMSVELEIKKCLEVLEAGGTILYPTDTIWGIGCDATNDKAVDKVYQLKTRMETRSLIILLDDAEKLSLYVKSIPEIARDLIRNVDTPLTIIYPEGQNLAKNVIGEDHSIAIRICSNEFCKSMIKQFGKPIVSTSANVSGAPTPLVFKNISKEITGHVDHVVSLFRDEFRNVKPSRIIRINDSGEFRIIRK
jgi:L-threonylcarbamoyladenylate synthase